VIQAVPIGRFVSLDLLANLFGTVLQEPIHSLLLGRRSVTAGSGQGSSNGKPVSGSIFRPGIPTGPTCAPATRPPCQLPGRPSLAEPRVGTRLGPRKAFAGSYLSRLCQTPVLEASQALAPLPPPAAGELGSWILQAPPLTGLEYLSIEALTAWWIDLDELVRHEIQRHAGGAQAYLSEKNPAWKFVGRVTFHLAENKRDAEHPFAFLATYASRLSSQGRVQHEPLGRALQQYAGVQNRQALLGLLVPIQRAAEGSSLVRELVDSGDVYHPRPGRRARPTVSCRTFPSSKREG
jgi:hypothetical protein